MTILRTATSVRRAESSAASVGAASTPVASVTLDHAERHLRRKLLKLDGGGEIFVDLEVATHVQDGDFFELDTAEVVRVVAAIEPVMIVLPGRGVTLAMLAWHIGNRHLSAQIDEDRIIVASDPVIEQMLRGLGAQVSLGTASFQPMPGAYHGRGHGQGHGHGHANSHRHDHGNGHGNAEGHGQVSDTGDVHHPEQGRGTAGRGAGHA
ncbi:MAG: urease accessory protein UreE [Pseudomonadota bacterium]